MPPTLRIAQLLVDTIPNLQKALAAVDVAHLDVQALHAICKKNSIVLTQDQQAYLMYRTCYLHDLAYIDRHPRAPKTSKDDLVKWLIHQFLIPATSLLRDWQSSVRDRDRDRDRSMSKPRWSDNFAVSSSGDDASSGDDESEDAYDDAHDEGSFNVALEPKVPVSVTRWVDAGMKEFLHHLPRTVWEAGDIPTIVAWFSVWIREKPVALHTTSMRFAGMRFITGSGEKDAKNFRNLMRRMRYLRDILNVGVFFNFQHPADRSKRVAHSHMIAREKEGWEQICNNQTQSPTLVVPCKFVNLPVPDWSAPRPAQLESFLKVLAEADCCVAGHCTAGMGRTGSFVLSGVKAAFPDVVGFESLCNIVGKDYREKAKQELMDIYKAIHDDPAKGHKEHPRWKAFAEFVSTANPRVVTRSWKRVLEAGAPLQNFVTETRGNDKARDGLLSNPKFLMDSMLAIALLMNTVSDCVLSKTMEMIWGVFIKPTVWHPIIEEAVAKGYLSQKSRSFIQWCTLHPYIFSITDTGRKVLEGDDRALKAPRFLLTGRKFKRSKSKRTLKTMADPSWGTYRAALTSPSTDQADRLDILRSLIQQSTKTKVLSRLKSMHDRRRVKDSTVSIARLIHSDRQSLL